MKTIAELIDETPKCSVVPWPFDPALRLIPEFVPADIRSLSEEFYQFHIFEEPTNDGLMTTPGSIQFYPDFSQSVVGDIEFLDPIYRDDPIVMGFVSCYTLAFLGMGNSQIILDASGTIPLIRHYYYPLEGPLEGYPILDMDFSEFIRICIASGQNISFYDSLKWNESKTKANKP